MNDGLHIVELIIVGFLLLFFAWVGENGGEKDERETWCEVLMEDSRSDLQLCMESGVEFLETGSLKEKVGQK